MKAYKKLKNMKLWIKIKGSINLVTKKSDYYDYDGKYLKIMLNTDDD